MERTARGREKVSHSAEMNATLALNYIQIKKHRKYESSIVYKTIIRSLIKFEFFILLIRKVDSNTKIVSRQDVNANKNKHSRLKHLTPQRIYVIIRIIIENTGVFYRGNVNAFRHIFLKFYSIKYIHFKVSGHSLQDSHSTTVLFLGLKAEINTIKTVQKMLGNKASQD